MSGLENTALALAFNVLVDSKGFYTPEELSEVPLNGLRRLLSQPRMG
jgi:hypothetical protein